MNTSMSRFVSLFLVVLMVFSPSLDWATCGGGGGGGRGGIAPGNGAENQVYHVPWKVMSPQDKPAPGGMVLYWVPSSSEQARASALMTSRMLSVYAGQCVTMLVVDPASDDAKKITGGSQIPVAVLSSSDGKVNGKVENQKGDIKVEQVEKLVEAEFKKREDMLKERLDEGRNKAKSGDKDGAITTFRAVYDQKCMFPGKAKDAAKELKKLGVTDVSEIMNPPILDKAQSAKIEQIMIAGLKAELNDKYEEARVQYYKAHQMDPSDPAPLRYLGELYRHHIGDWQKARVEFTKILNMPADPLSRAVALHGIGKMTIHEGEFAKGLGLMEDSIKEYPLALAYRNIAVYWNSEGNPKKADYYTREALKLDPKDPFNLVFAAAFMAGNGHGEEALKIARENEKLMPASYNLAAIYAQTGNKEKALALLKRHFFEYERNQSVRAKEMMEARVDTVFASLMKDPNFISLTSGADGVLDSKFMHH